MVCAARPDGPAAEDRLPQQLWISRRGRSASSAEHRRPGTTSATSPAPSRRAGRATTPAPSPPGSRRGCGTAPARRRSAWPARSTPTSWRRVYTPPARPARPGRARPRDVGGGAGASRPRTGKYRSADEIYAGLLDAATRTPGPEERAALRVQAERSARQAVSFLDVTFSAPKSVTVLGVAFERAANDAAAAGDHEAAAAWAAHAAGRRGGGAGRRPRGDRLPAGRGRLLPRRAPRRRRRAVDRRARVRRRAVPAARLPRPGPAAARPPGHPQPRPVLRRAVARAGRQGDPSARAAAGAIAERVMEAHLARSVGARVETRPDGRAREVVGVDRDVLDLFSSRAPGDRAARARSWSPGSRTGSGARRRPTSGRSSPSRSRWPPGGRSRTRARPASSSSTGGRPMAAPAVGGRAGADRPRGARPRPAGRARRRSSRRWTSSSARWPRSGSTASTTPAPT